jgi:ABC-type multidrug transport system fused ATPase/permease subunit
MMFLVLAGCLGIAIFVQIAAFTVMGERLTTRTVVEEGDVMMMLMMMMIIMMLITIMKTVMMTTLPWRAGMRRLAFASMVRQDIAFFDEEENATGSLTARLATEAALVKNITGQNLGRAVQNLVVR